MNILCQFTNFIIANYTSPFTEIKLAWVYTNTLTNTQAIPPTKQPQPETEPTPTNNRKQNKLEHNNNDNNQ